MTQSIEIPAALRALEPAARAAMREIAGDALTDSEGLFGAVFEVAAWIEGRRKAGRLYCVGLSGAQGSGKSTFAALLEHVLNDVFSTSARVLSLDDFYRTRRERAALAESIHPLLRVRGVPGTHDMVLLAETIARLKDGHPVQAPRFDKATDDRAAEMRTLAGGAEVLLVEGWCWGARAVNEEDLAEPVNRLEAEQDPDGRWRQYVNRCLAQAYQPVFDTMDALIFLAVPDMEAVFRWRLQQERELAAGSQGAAIMDEAGVRRFIMYYERITRRMLEDIPARADITIHLDHRHAIRDLAAS